MLTSLNISVLFCFVLFCFVLFCFVLSCHAMPQLRVFHYDPDVAS
jgi:hypothetical protein